MSSLTTPPSERKVILVTGGNRGIGLAIIHSLAVHPQTATTTILLMGCRDTAKGDAAISELRSQLSSTTLATASDIHPVELDVSSDDSIRAAVTSVRSTYGRLDVLVNNAGYAAVPKAEDLSDVRPSFRDTFDVNVTSVYMTTALFLGLLRESAARSGGSPKVITVTSARGSLTRSSTGQLPPTAVVAYSVSKTAVNALTLEMSRAKENEGVEFQLAAPGHCRTAFNGFRGLRDPMEGADVVIELIIGERRKLGYWETVGSDRGLREVPW